MAKRFLSDYERRMISDTGCSETEVIQVEDIMRHDVLHFTLDWLTPDEFREDAVLAHSVFKLLESNGQFPNQY